MLPNPDAICAIRIVVKPRATTMPSTVPMSASSMLSTSSCTTSRRRAAPIARRTAISFSRALARASNRLARFAHAISSTRPVAPSSTANGSPNCARMFDTPDEAGIAVSLFAWYFFSPSSVYPVGRVVAMMSGDNDAR